MQGALYPQQCVGNNGISVAPLRQGSQGQPLGMRGVEGAAVFENRVDINQALELLLI